MKAININPIVLIIVNIIAPSMYMFLSGKFIQVFLLVFAAALMALMGRFKRLAIYLLIYGAIMGIYYVTMQIKSIEATGLFLIVLVQCVPCIALASILVSKFRAASVCA